MSWFYLILAGMLEIGWPLGLKLTQQEGYRWQGIATALACIVGSGFSLFLAQKHIPMGTAYAVWTGIGAAGAFLVGVAFFNDAANFGRWLGAFLIISGVIVMKLSSH
ncbi:TPA: DMT family transporter [Neisseria subflava]|nr:multidrug efflux SMR transporter [Neisseria mucosa]